MSYLVLARKYRPQTFEDVVQQSHITQTLSHAILANRVAHALLFTGPRGTGKTTVARIVAKALNCQKGPTPTPCNRCPSCMEITNGNAADVFEIDGASNNSVDQIRELRENIPYMPSASRYKIYIIDEVHMLSLAAFNALLKTLEEPPAHIIFLFATTEPHKIPVTILSRCQRHDMRRISTSAIAEHLALLCQKEGFELPSNVLTMIAREAEGSMRDALSLLDQVLSCSDGSLAYEQILGLFGIIDRKIIFDLAQALLDRNMSDILDILSESYQRGQDMRRVYGELIDHFRNLLIVSIGHHVDKLVDLPGQELELLQRQCSAVSSAALSQLFDFIFREEQSVRLATQPKLAVEMVFFRMIQIPPALSIDELIIKLDALKSSFSQSSAFYKETNRPISEGQTSIIETASNGPEKKIFEENGRPRQESKPLQKAVGRVASQMNEPTGSLAETLPAASSDHRSMAKKHVRPETMPNHQPPNVKREDIWKELRSLVGKQKPSLGSVLSNCRVMSMVDDCLTIEIDDNGYTNRIVNKNLHQLEEWCRELTGLPIKLKLVVKNDSQRGSLIKREATTKLKNEALSHPLVLAAIEEFSGKVAEVKILSGGKKK